MSDALLARTVRSRVRRPRDKSLLLNELTESEKGGVFESYAKALAFSAALGLREGRRTPYSGSDEQIAWSIFEESLALFQTIALVETGDIEILAPERFGEILTIFEEYANGGLELLDDALANHPSRDQVEVCSEFMLQRETSEDLAPDPTELLKGLLSEPL